jgi:hypothetical protein
MSHASKGGRRWRYYVSRAALTGRKQDAGSVVRIPASEIENRVARAVGAHLAGQTNTIDGCRADHGILGGIQAVTQHGQTRRLRQDPLTEKDVRNAIERITVSATRIEIVLNESVVAEGQDRVLTLPWTRTSSRRRREIIGAQSPLRPLHLVVRETEFCGLRLAPISGAERGRTAGIRFADRDTPQRPELRGFLTTRKPRRFAGTADRGR